MERMISKLVATTAAWTTMLGVPYAVFFVRLIAPEVTWENIVYSLIWTFIIVIGFIAFHVYLLHKILLAPLGDYFDREGQSDPEIAARALKASINLPLIGLYPTPAWFIGIVSVVIFMYLLNPLPFLPMLKTVGIGTFTGLVISGLQVFWLRNKMVPIIKRILKDHPELLSSRRRIGVPVSINALVISVISLIIVTSLVAGLWANRALVTSAVTETIARMVKKEVLAATAEVDKQLKPAVLGEQIDFSIRYLEENPEYSIFDVSNCTFPFEADREKLSELSCSALRAHNNGIDDQVWFEQSKITETLMIYTRLARDGHYLIRFVNTSTYLDGSAASSLPSYMLLLYMLMLAGFLAYLMAKSITDPLRSLKGLTAKISSGDLNAHVSVYTENEIGDLASGMSFMVKNLKKIIGNINRMVEHLESSQTNVSSIAEVFKSGAAQQNETVDRTVSSVENINELTGQIEENLADLATSSDEVSSSVFEMDSTLTSISESISSLTASVSETGSSITEMASAIKQVAGNSNNLSDVAAETAGAMEFMGESIKTVEENAKATAEFSQMVSESARDGVDAVENTIWGIEEIERTVENLFDIITILQNRTKEVNKIIGVIENITKRTNLLSLNASIIAAGAGEHGQGFAVVANEIRDLADKTSASTKVIASVINSTARDTNQAVDAIAGGRKKVAEGMQLAQNAAEALRQILEHAVASGQRVDNIAVATGEQVQSSKMLTESIARVAEMTKQISKATGSLSGGIEQILVASENISNRASNVSKSSSEQARGFNMVTKSVESITEMIKQIYQSTQMLASSTSNVFESILQIKDIAHNNQSGAGKMEGEVMQMAHLSEQLETHLRLFEFGNQVFDEWDV